MIGKVFPPVSGVGTETKTGRRLAKNGRLPADGSAVIRDRLAKIAYHLGVNDRGAFWQGRAEAIKAKILAEAWSEERKAFTDAFGGRNLDAGVLLMAERTCCSRQKCAHCWIVIVSVHRT